MTDHIETTPVDACPLCRSRESEIILRDVQDTRLGVSGAWTFVRCRACDVVFQTPRPTDPTAAYPRNYSQHRTSAAPRIESASRAKTWMRRAILAACGYDVGASRACRETGRLLRLSRELRYSAFHASMIQPPGPPAGRLLDLGCGNGRFVAWARLVGWQACGVESDPVTAAIAREISGAEIYPSLDDLPLDDQPLDHPRLDDRRLDGRQPDGRRFDDLPPVEGAFAVITVNHVLEHLADPAATLAHLHRLLRPGGLLYIGVPNWNSQGRSLFGTRWIGLEPSRHLVMFDPPRLRRLVEQHGFVVESIRTTSMRERERFDENWQLRFGTAAPALLTRAVKLASIVADIGNDEIILRARRVARSVELR